MKHPDDRKTVVLVVDDAIDSIRMINDALEEAGLKCTTVGCDHRALTARKMKTHLKIGI